MTRISDDASLREREKLDGRIAFVAAAVALAYGFVALLDRVGAPLALVEAVAPYFTILAFATLGALLHSMRVSTYYAAGRAVPFEYAGFALAALVAGLILPFAPQFSGRSWLFGVAGGVFTGVAAIGFYLGPMLRKTGAVSFSGLLAARFPSVATRVGVIALACAASALIALAGEQSAVDVLAGVLGGGRGLSAAVVGCAVLLIAGPGGLLGTIWTAAAAGAVAVVGLGWPALILALRGAPPFGGAADASGDAAARLEDWGALANAPSPGAGVIVMLAVTLGIATLAPLLAPAIATQTSGRARLAGCAAFGWTFVFAFLIAVGLAGATLSLARQCVGQAPAHLPDAVYAASGHGLVTICGARAPDPASARRACAGKSGSTGAPLRAKDFRVNGALFLAELPGLEQMGAAASGLLASAQIALALALAAAGLQAFGTALGHEAIYRFRGNIDLTSRRLITTRLALLTVAAAGAAASVSGFFDARALIAFALALSAAAMAPVAALAPWSRADDRDALYALLGGLLGMTMVILLAGDPRDGDVLAGAALTGALLGFAAGVWSALSRPAGSAHGRAFVARLTRGDGAVMEPEKGA
ncbi:MAG TPA: sodium:solute symporter [Methylocystis sp.]|jgi:cation/acetate symporter